MTRGTRFRFPWVRVQKSWALITADSKMLLFPLRYFFRMTDVSLRP